MHRDLDLAAQAVTIASTTKYTPNVRPVIAMGSKGL